MMLNAQLVFWGVHVGAYLDSVVEREMGAPFASNKYELRT